MSRSTNLRVGLASKGGYEEATSRFLSGAGLGVWRPNPRQYVGRISSVEGAEVLFQRPEDIVHKVADGSLDLGISGYDLVAEHAVDDPAVHVVIPDLGFRRCELVLAVPDAWLDIAGINDLADLAIKFKRQGRTLRIATKFTNLVSDYLYRHGVNYFELITAHGALEAAPSLGYADVIADLSETGVTLRDNHLRVIEGGVVLKAQACLIGNVTTIGESPNRLEQARKIIELCEAKLAARRFRIVTANVSGESQDAVADHIIGNLDVAGERGPTVSPVFPKDPRAGNWFSVSVIVPEDRMLAAVDHLRQAGSTGITVSSPDYMFANQSESFAKLCAAVREARQT
ncbi:ATP phosphoribosyltransferase [soil metagenome]